MHRRRGATTAAALVAVLVPALVLTASTGDDPGTGTAGSPGIGDPYHPLDGNGGYDVQRYDLDVRYDPGTDELAGRATVTAVADQELSRFHLDLTGLTGEEVTVDGQRATARRTADELVVTPAWQLRAGQVFSTVVREWVSSRAGGTATTADFVALAEEVSGQELDELFQTWLYTPGKPAGLG